VPTGTLNAATAPVWVASDQGFFRRQGLEVDVVGTTPAVAGQAVSSGSVPLAVSGGGSVSAWVAGASDLVFVAGLVNKVTHKIVGRPEVTRLDDLRGKAVGSTTAGATGTIALREGLRLSGVDPDRDVEIVYLRDQPGLVGGLLSGAVLGAVLGSPFSEQAVGEGARVLADLREMNVEMMTIGIVTTRSLLERDADLVRRFLVAYVEGIRHAREQPGDTVESIMRATRNTNRAETEAAYATYRDLWDPWLSERGIQVLIDNMDVPGAQNTRAADLIDDRLLRELAARGLISQPPPR
jgi:NitT/TauT family transport system substrate-binding protein